MILNKNGKLEGHKFSEFNLLKEFYSKEISKVKEISMKHVDDVYMLMPKVEN